MARYKRIDAGLKLLPVDLSRLLIPGSFEHALSHLLDHELDLRHMDERFENDETRALAYAPSVLLKVILYGYARGMIGREMFAIDGVKLPSNASKTKTGTRAEFERQAGKIETEVKKMLSRHRKADAQVVAPELAQKEAPRVWSG